MRVSTWNWRSAESSPQTNRRRRVTREVSFLSGIRKKMLRTAASYCNASSHGSEVTKVFRSSDHANALPFGVMRTKHPGRMNDAVVRINCPSCKVAPKNTGRYLRIGIYG